MRYHPHLHRGGWCGFSQTGSYMKSKALVASAICALFPVVTAGQAPSGGRGQGAAQPPATDTLALGIAGVVAAGAKVHVIKVPMIAQGLAERAR